MTQVRKNQATKFLKKNKYFSLRPFCLTTSHASVDCHRFIYFEIQNKTKMCSSFWGFVVVCGGGDPSGKQSE